MFWLCLCQHESQPCREIVHKVGTPESQNVIRPEAEKLYKNVSNFTGQVQTEVTAPPKKKKKLQQTKTETNQLINNKTKTTHKHHHHQQQTKNPSLTENPYQPCFHTAIALLEQMFLTTIKGALPGKSRKNSSGEQDSSVVC